MTTTSRYSIYGVSLATDFPFATPLVPTEADPDVEFIRTLETPHAAPWRGHEPLFESSTLEESGEPALYLYRASGVDVLHYTGVADYYLWPDRIVCHQLASGVEASIELYLLGLVFCFWLEKRGRCVIHASAVSVDGRAAVFLATNAGGKTSLAASLVEDGHPMLTDDFLAMSVGSGQVIGYPAFPQMRMWPDLATHFLGTAREFPRVLPGVDKRRVPVRSEGGLGPFGDEPCPLERLYLPERRPPGERGDKISFQPVTPRDAVVELIRESFLTRILEMTGLHEERFRALARVAESVAMVRLSYPSGLEHLPRVRQAILEDLGAG
jgi:hypothetical protein